MYELGDVVLDTNRPVTFTYNINKTFDTSMPSTVQSKIQADMAPYGTVTKVDRGLFSGRYTITIIPMQSMDPSVWQYLLKNSLAKAGYPKATFVAMEGGTTSSVPGGSKQVIKVAAQKVGTDIVAPAVEGAVYVAKSAAGPLLPIVAVVLAGYLGFIYLQSKVRGK